MKKSDDNDDLLRGRSNSRSREKPAEAEALSAGDVPSNSQSAGGPTDDDYPTVLPLETYLKLSMEKRINANNVFEMRGFFKHLERLKDEDPLKIDFGLASRMISVAAEIYGYEVDNICYSTRQLYREASQVAALRYCQSPSNVPVSPEDDQLLTKEVDESCSSEQLKRKGQKTKKAQKKADNLPIDLDAFCETDHSKITLTQEEFEQLYDPTYQQAMHFREDTQLEAGLLHVMPVVDDSAEVSLSQLPSKPFQWSSDTLSSQLLTSETNGWRKMSKVVNKLRVSETSQSVLSARLGGGGGGHSNEEESGPSLAAMAKSVLLDAETQCKKDLQSLNANLSSLQYSSPIPSTAIGHSSTTNVDESALSEGPMNSLHSETTDLPLLDLNSPVVNASSQSSSPMGSPSIQSQQPPSVLLDSIGDSGTERSRSPDRSQRSATLFSSLLSPSILSSQSASLSTSQIQSANVTPLDEDRTLTSYAVSRCESQSSLPVMCSDATVADDDQPVAVNSSPTEEYEESEDDGMTDSVLSATPLLGAQSQMPPWVSHERTINSDAVKRRILDMLKGDNADDGSMHPVDFSEICRNLANSPADVNQNLTIQSAFVCLLHLCTEHGLELIPKDDDFTVIKASSTR